jgi:anti-anti-sigma regulatory factor
LAPAVRGYRSAVEESEIVVTRSSPEVAVVTLKGDHDSYSVPLLNHALRTAAESVACVVVDLTRTTFVDSHLLSELAAARTLWPETSILIAAEQGSHPESVLRVVRYDRIFPVLASVAAALEACAERSRLTPA